MGIIHGKPHKELFADYYLLKNYAIFREYCFNDNGDLLKVRFDPELRERYAYTYECMLHTDINPVHKNASLIVKKKLEDVIIPSTRIDGITFTLLYASNMIEMNIRKASTDPKDENKITKIFTYFTDNKIEKSYIIEKIGIDAIGKTINEDVKIIKKKLKLNIEGHIQKLVY